MECSEIEDLIHGNDLCGLVLDPDQPANPFSTCFTRPGIEVPIFGENCFFDVCANANDGDAMKEAACGTLAALAAECANAGVLVDWRGAANCRE